MIQIHVFRKFFNCISSRKKLRDIEALEAKLASGEISAPEPEQLEKVSETDLHLLKSNLYLSKSNLHLSKFNYQFFCISRFVENTFLSGVPES